MSWLDLWMTWCIAFGGFKTGGLLVGAVRWVVDHRPSVDGSPAKAEGSPL